VNGYEFKHPYFAIIGTACAILWLLDFSKIFKSLTLELSILGKGTSNFKRLSVMALGLAGWVLISISLTQPRFPVGYSKSKIKVNDIFFVFDVSKSMHAEDLKPNRLEVAKKKLQEFIKLRPTDRIGVVLFSERVFTLLPLTFDIDVVSKVIGDIKIGYLGSGTNIGDGLGLAIARAVKSETKNKVIVLLTDGVSTGGSITEMQAANDAKKHGIKIYTIGIGNPGAMLPIGNGPFGKRYIKMPGGSIDFKILEEVAKVTGGQTYVAKNEDALKDVLVEINQLEKTDVDASAQVIYDERYFNFLFWGIIIFLLSEILKNFWLKEVQ
jgi:Ca-activated chloride channel family protein